MEKITPDRYRALTSSERRKIKKNLSKMTANNKNREKKRL